MSSKASKAWFLVIVIAAPIVTGLVLGWLFSLDGTLGLYQWMSEFRSMFIAVGVLGVIAPLLVLVARLVTRARRVLRALAVVFAIIGIVVPLAAAGYFLRDSLAFSPSTPPLLLVMDGAGAQGAPNLALVFRTAQETLNTLYYGEESLGQQVTEAHASREHVLPLKDLKPGTRYQWRLNDGAPCSFETPAGPISNDVLYHFGVSGDAHFGAELSASASGDPQVVRSILTYVSDPRHPFDTFFVVGDVVNMGSTNGDWQRALDTIAPFTCGVPLRPLMGNHDAIINGAPHYLAYFYPDKMEARTGSRLYYRIDSGRVHFIMLNMLWGVESFSAEQRAWFVKQMESIPSDDWKIVMMHSMVYSSGSVFDGYPWYDPAAMVQEFAPLLEKYKVDLVVSGHNHHLEFLQKNGVSYAVAGGFGGKLDPEASHTSTGSVWYIPQQHGFLDVVVRPASLELSFRNPAGAELKAFTVSKTR